VHRGACYELGRGCGFLAFRGVLLGSGIRWACVGYSSLLASPYSVPVYVHLVVSFPTLHILDSKSLESPCLYSSPKFLSDTRHDKAISSQSCIKSVMAVNHIMIKVNEVRLSLSSSLAETLTNHYQFTLPRFHVTDTWY
jgi:hypothetical protein